MQLPNVLTEPFPRLYSPRDLSVQRIWPRVADCGFTEDKYIEFWATARVLHEPDRDYRNFRRHARFVLLNNLDLYDRAEAGGITLNKEVVATAPLGHDINPDDEWDSSEKYARLAKRLGIETEAIELGVDAIRSTAEGGKTETVEDKSLLTADIANVGGGYETFFSPTRIKVWREYKKVNEKAGTPYSVEAFDDMTITKLSGYLVRNLSLGEANRAWTEKAQENLWQHACEVSWGRDFMSPAEYLRQLGSPAVEELFGDRLS